MYRDQAWAIFQAFNKHCRLPSGGYATIRDVDEVPAVHEDRMETFWIVSRRIPRCLMGPQLTQWNASQAESLKYLYLIFANESVVPLDKFVFSTEAHILPQFTPEVTR